jgi:hypothetical protein
VCQRSGVTTEAVGDVEARGLMLAG